MGGANGTGCGAAQALRAAGRVRVAAVRTVHAEADERLVVQRAAPGPGRQRRRRGRRRRRGKLIAYVYSHVFSNFWLMFGEL